MSELLKVVFDMWYIFVMPLLVGLGIVVGMILASPRKNRVIKMEPNSNRGFEFNVKEENAFSIYCDGLEGQPPQRFLKYMPAFLILKKTRTRHQTNAVWLAREGTAYTQRVGGAGELVKIPLSTAMRTVFGEEMYHKIPDNVRQRIEEDKMPVTVELAQDPITPDKMPVVGEEDIKREEDKMAAQNLWHEFKSEAKGWILNYIACMGLGGLIVTVAYFLLGIIKIWQPTPEPPPVTGG